MVRYLLAGLIFFVATLSGQAQPAKTPERPLIFIPGIIGSQIWIGGEEVWGGARSLANLSRLEIADGPKSTTPAATCGPGTVYGDCGLIEEIGILGPIKINEYGGFINYLETLGYTRQGPSRNLFIFSYDWRRSSFETAEGLKSFIQATPELAGHDIDILAHSLGGLAALVYADRYDSPAAGEDCATSSRCRIKTMITAGTPYYGSMDAVATPVEGWGWVSRVLAGGTAAIAKSVLSWPSLYELLPTYSGCCGSSGTESMADYSVFSQLPYARGPNAPIPAKVRAALQNRRELDTLAQKGWPKHIVGKSKQCSDGVERDRLYMIAGDHNDTRRQVTISNGGLEYDLRRGDGTVLLRSASLNSPNQAWLSFSTHRSILDDDNVRAKLETILLRCQIALTDFNSVEPIISLQRDAGGVVDVPVETASTNIIQEMSGSSLAFSVKASLSVSPPSDEVAAPSATLAAMLDGKKFLSTDLKLTNTTQDGANRVFAYAARELKLPHPGLLEISVTFAGNVSVADQAMAF